MARHRVGDTYLSDAEYTQHQIETWLAIVFVAGAALAGIAVHWACPGDCPKGIRFILIIGAAYGGGTLAAWLNAEILWLCQTALTFFIGYKLLQFLWSVI